MKALINTQAALAAALLLGMGAAAHAQTITGGAAPVNVDSNFTTLFGTDGSIQFDTLPANNTTAYGNLQNIVTQTADGTTNIIVQPSYVSSVDGVVTNYAYVAVAGYYAPISPGVQAGIVGATSGDYFSFTVGAGVPTVFNFGILTNYSNLGEEPDAITLTSGTATASDTPDHTVSYSGRNNLFTITGASPGQTFTVNISGNKFISGATFDTVVAAAPEPSAFAALAIGVLGLGVLGLQARRRAGVAA